MPRKSIDLNLVLVKNSKYSRYYLKKRIIKDNILNYICEICRIEPYWNNKKLVLHLDHINGISNDNRLENLRFLCPNCHSQTETYTGKNIKKKKIIKNCKLCFLELDNPKNSYHKECLDKVKKMKRPHTEKIVWPSIQELIEMVDSYGYSKTGKILGVSDNAVRKKIMSL